MIFLISNAKSILNTENTLVVIGVIVILIVTQVLAPWFEKKDRERAERKRNARG